MAPERPKSALPTPNRTNPPNSPPIALSPASTARIVIPVGRACVALIWAVALPPTRPAEWAATGRAHPSEPGTGGKPDSRGSRASAHQLLRQEVHQQAVHPRPVEHPLVASHDSDRSKPDLRVRRDGPAVGSG